MINNPKLINKVISQIKSLTYEQITEVIRKVDMEEAIERVEILVNYGLSSSLNEKDLSAIKNVVNRLKEDEAVIDKICTDIGLDYGYDKDDVITRYREKVKNERNKG